jgi:hypothetical protein
VGFWRPIAIAGLFTLGAAGAADAACDPPCEKGEVCRYEAAGDNFYCQAPVLKPETKPKPKPGPDTTPPADDTTTPDTQPTPRKN